MKVIDASCPEAHAWTMRYSFFSTPRAPSLLPAGNKQTNPSTRGRGPETMKTAPATTSSPSEATVTAVVPAPTAADTRASPERNSLPAFARVSASKRNRSPSPRKPRARFTQSSSSSANAGRFRANPETCPIRAGTTASAKRTAAPASTPTTARVARSRGRPRPDR